MEIYALNGDNVDVQNKSFKTERSFAGGNIATVPADTLDGLEAATLATAKHSTSRSRRNGGRRPRRECGRGRR